MAKQRKKRRKRLSNKGKITLQQRMRIVEKNDATRVQKQKVIPRMKAQMPRTVAPVFKVKIRKK
jgi:hypothetical protein